MTTRTASVAPSSGAASLPTLAARGQPSLAMLMRYFLVLGAVGFGGPAALVDRMRRDLHEARAWVSKPEFDLGLAIAAACPGPLAYQLAVFCGYVRHGLAGAFGVGLAFAFAPFLLVVMVAGAYDRWSASELVRGLFHGAAPAVVALIARACWTLGRKTLHHAWPAWLVCGAGFGLTWLTGREPLWLFIAAGALGAVMLRPAPRVPAPTPQADPGAVPLPRDRSTKSQVSTRPQSLWFALGVPALAGPTGQLFVFFFKTGCLVFGSGLVIVPFLQSAVVDQYRWLTPQQFLDSVTVGLVSPGPVVITATFVGYLVARLPGAISATVGMFLPAILFTIGATPWFARHRDNRRLTGLVRGVTAAVVGVLAGAVPLVANGALPDPSAWAILAVAIGLMKLTRVPDPLIVIVCAAVGTMGSGLES